MTTLSRDNRAAVEFAHAYAVSHGLDASQHDLLVAKTDAVVDWLKRFRRTLSFAKRYPHDHPQRQSVVDELLQETGSFTSRFGDLVLVLAPDHSETSEGFHLPPETGHEFGHYTFYPMFRDGIARLAVHPGASRFDLDLLLDVVASDGRRDDDDAYTWIWRERPPCLTVVVEPSLTATSATSLAAHDAEDPALHAFLEALSAAGPFYSGSDGRTTFNADTLEGLARQGIDPEYARRLLLDRDASQLLHPVDPDAAAQLRRLYSHAGDRDARLAAASSTHLDR